MKRLMYLIFVGLILSSCSTVKMKEERKSFEPCGISLKSISKNVGFPGDIIELFGLWGYFQGEKIPRINKGTPNDLEVISWSNSIIKVKIPQGLAAGDYKIGVNCNDLSKGGSYSSGWEKFEILNPAPAELSAAGSTTQPSQIVKPSPPTAQDSFLETQLDQLVRNISASLSQQKRSRLAVIEFTDLNGNVSGLGKFLAEELTTKLFASGSFQVVERRLIEKILQEQQLSMSGIIDEETVIKVGSLLGVDFIATGTTADLGSSIKINARIISVEKGVVFSVASAMIPNNDQVKMLMGKNMERLPEPVITRQKLTMINNDQLLLDEMLFEAVENGQTELVRDLVRQGADVDVRGIAGENTSNPTKEWTPLLVASHKGYTKIAAILLENGADINAQNYGTRTPLHLAAEKGHIEIVKMLIAKGVDVHTTSSHDQWTPLHVAVYSGQTSVALVLLEAKADPLVINVQGSTPLDYAKEKGLTTIIKVIEALPQKP
ncbi:MAG: ankyrin repeat domain-containing protein [Proteobacteria bacterium]|nr:ankyrin repeat domain-containing protein [Pseudomonadota bacterium]MBU1716665.1 ankyrin repeat domain-containing protein [Pseudomonadota bacterium]